MAWHEQLHEGASDGNGPLQRWLTFSEKGLSTTCSANWLLLTFCERGFNATSSANWLLLTSDEQRAEADFGIGWS